MTRIDVLLNFLYKSFTKQRIRYLAANPENTGRGHTNGQRLIKIHSRLRPHKTPKVGETDARRDLATR
ncbi:MULTISPECIES: hypothetical protein [Pseudomonas]|jgi:hypothetical protein|uniref:Uncharacterized protein n=1 Tax=Pseudomonas monsensis TaxID=2745509 RepID=A0ABT3YT12_9PSED|nr:MULTISPECIES: hypothetical protein [Pseudomonas]MCY0108637.1 hypothetical protein [Pseudomonas monsensis]MDZ3830125.1 hypothetical protein [Pseudomonas monsensis]QXI01632.1 hypothetical protein HV782_006430 [Pseudomonas monsensis]